MTDELKLALAGCDVDSHPSWAEETRATLDRLAACGVTHVRELFAAYRERGPELRRNVVYVLGRLQRQRHVNALLEWFDREPAAAVRHEIVEALAKIGGPMAMWGLSRWLADTSRPSELRTAAVYNLRSDDAKGADIVDVLLRVAAAQGEDPRVREMVIESLGYQADEDERDEPGWRRIVDVLLACLDDASGEVRFWAIYSLGQVGAECALPALRRLAKSDDFVASLGWPNREEARDVVHYLETGEHLDPDAYERMSAG